MTKLINKFQIGSFKARMVQENDWYWVQYTGYNSRYKDWTHEPLTDPVDAALKFTYVCEFQIERYYQSKGFDTEQSYYSDLHKRQKKKGRR